MKIVKKEKVVAAGCKNLSDFRESTNVAVIVQAPLPVRVPAVYSGTQSVEETVSSPVKVDGVYPILSLWGGLLR